MISRKWKYSSFYFIRNSVSEYYNKGILCYLQELPKMLERLPICQGCNTYIHTFFERLVQFLYLSWALYSFLPNFDICSQMYSLCQSEFSFSDSIIPLLFLDVLKISFFETLENGPENKNFEKETPEECRGYIQGQHIQIWRNWCRNQLCKRNNVNIQIS